MDRFVNRPTGTLPELWEECARMDERSTRVIVKDFAIGTTETPLAHGMGVVPQGVFWAPHSDVSVWRSSAPDSRFVYLIASSACVADVEVVR